MQSSRRLTLLMLLWMLPSLALAASHFDGADSAIVITQQASINISAFTVGCWGTYNTLGEGSLGRLMEKDTGWILRLQSGTPAKLRLTAQGWTTQGDWQMNLQAVGVWGHWAVSYDASSVANVPVLYLNGVGSAGVIATPTGTTFAPGTGNLVIGNNTASTRTWDGDLAECFFYNRILTANEVIQVKTGGPPSLPRGLIGYWPLGVFGGRNYTSTAGLTGTPTSVTVATTNPPLAYASQSQEYAP